MAALSTLVDDFSGTTLDLSKWRDDSGANGTQVVSGGKLRLQPSPAAGTPQAVITTATTYTWSGSFLYARLVPSAQTGFRTSLLVGDNASAAMIEVAIQDGTVSLSVTGTTGTVAPNNGSVGTFDPVAFNYLRIDFQTASTLIQRSPDATNWTTVASGTYTSGWSVNAYAKLRATAVPGQTQSEGQVDSFNVRSTAETGTSGAGPRMSIPRPAGTAQRSTPRAGTAPRAYAARASAGTVASNAGAYAAASGPRVKAVRATATATAVTGTTGTAVKARPTAGLLWPRAR